MFSFTGFWHQWLFILSDISKYGNDANLYVHQRHNNYLMLPIKSLVPFDHLWLDRTKGQINLEAPDPLFAAIVSVSVAITPYFRSNVFVCEHTWESATHTTVPLTLHRVIFTFSKNNKTKFNCNVIPPENNSLIEIQQSIQIGGFVFVSLFYGNRKNKAYAWILLVLKLTHVLRSLQQKKRAQQSNFH